MPFIIDQFFNCRLNEKKGVGLCVRPDQDTRVDWEALVFQAINPEIAQRAHVLSLELRNEPVKENTLKAIAEFIPDF